MNANKDLVIFSFKKKFPKVFRFADIVFQGYIYKSILGDRTSK